MHNWKVGSLGSNKPPRFTMGINTPLFYIHIYFFFLLWKVGRASYFSFLLPVRNTLTNNLNPRVHAGTFLDKQGRISINMVWNNQRAMWKEDKNKASDSKVLKWTTKRTKEQSLCKNQKEETLELPSWGLILLQPSCQSDSAMLCTKHVLSLCAQWCCRLCCEQDGTTAVNGKWKRDVLLQSQSLKRCLM